MQSRISIRKTFSMSDWQQMDRFIAITHGENHVLRNKPLFEWFFLRNDSKDIANLIVAYEGDKLISLLGYLPTKFLWGRDVINGVWMAHWMTLEEYRFGIGALLMKKMTEMFPIVAGQGASSMNEKIVTKMKFEFLKQIPKVVYVFNHDKIWHTFNFRVKKKIDGGIEKDGVPKEAKLITEEIYRPNWSLYPSLRYGTLRDCDYITFRYIDYPFFKYFVFIEGDPCTPAVCVIRIIYTTAGIRIARILEFFFPDQESGEMETLLFVRKCINFCKQQNCDYVDFYCTANTPINLLLKAGFNIDNMGVLPSLIDPIDMSRKFQNLEIYVSSELKNKYPNCEGEFYVTRADGDQDRPNESYRKEGATDGKIYF